MHDNYNILIVKVNKFIRKYYKNLMIRGLIYSLSIILALFFFADLIEYFTWSGVIVRTIIFYTFLSVVVMVLIFYVLIPSIKLFHIGKALSNQQAAKIIGVHFPEVSDKLLNTLQLQEMAKNGHTTQELQLLEASIDQRSAQLNPIPFSKAIDLKKNVKHLKYLVPIALVIIAILIVFPAFITEPSKRIVNHSVNYEKPLPYRINVINNPLEALQHEDYIIVVKAVGNEIPAKVMISHDSFTYRMVESKPGIYEYTFQDINSDIHFQLETDDYTSSPYHIKVYPKPVIYSFDVVLNYPAYLNNTSDVIENSGDLVVPEGTEIEWNIYTKDSKNVIFKSKDETRVLESEESNVFKTKETADENFYYTLLAENEFVKAIDSISFSVQVVKDEYPTINVNEIKEESIFGFSHYNGSIGDDHGFVSLSFYYRKDTIGELPWQNQKLRILPSVPQQHYSYTVQAGDFGLVPGESISYFFEVRDNDAINGYKKTRSGTFYLALPDASELEKNIDLTSGKIKKELKETMDELDKVNQELEELQMSIFEKQELNWMDKKQLAELLKKEEALQEKIRNLEQMNKEISDIEEMLNKQTNADLAEKLEQMEDLFEKLKDENLERQLEELQKELEEFSKDKLNEYLENIRKKNEQLKSSLEQNLEFYKQLEFEKKLNETIDKLSELAEEQKQLAEETGEKELSEEQSLSEQEEIKEKFAEVEEDLKKAEELNEQLEKPFEVGTDDEQAESIKSEMNEASESLEKGKQKKASQSQQSAGEQMEKMAESLSMMMQSSMQSRMGEDAESIKKILDNLIDLSFSQEKLMSEIQETSKNDPKYVDNIDQLKLLNDDFGIVHDSLIAISKRQMMVQQFIVNESNKVISYEERALISMQDRKKGKALTEQQYAMTSMNNLALMLAESLDKMQQSMSMQMSGQMSGQECPNPGDGQPSPMDAMIQMQSELNSSMNKEGKKEGKEGKDGMNGSSEELARMAASQSEIRRRLQEYVEDLESEGGQGNALSKLIEEMKKSEEDIVNRRITQETLDRQKEIEVRLLKSEKAKQEREKEKKRESKEGKNRISGNQNNELEYKTENEIQEEILITVPIEMSPYYRELYKKYLYKLEKENGNQ